MTLTTWIILTIVSLAVSAFFSGMEIAFITSDRVRVEIDVSKGGAVSHILSRFYANSDFFISTILVGNNIALVIYGMGAAALLKAPLERVCDNEALLLVSQTLVSTAVILLVGEFMPKSIFRINPNSSFRIFAVPVYVIYLLLYPVSYFTTAVSRGLMHLFGIRENRPGLGTLSVGDLNQYLEQTIDNTTPDAKERVIENEVKIFQNALDFSSTHLRDCMQPRNEIVAVNIDNTGREELSALFTSSGRSKIVVYREDIDNVLGYIHVSELFDPDVDWRERLKPVLFAPETLLANKMMRRLLSEKRSMAVVIDEFGGTAGLVTLEDLVEEIFGEIQDEHDQARIEGREIAPGVYELPGRMEIEDLRNTFRLDIPESDDYQTLAGYILNETGTIPAQGETIRLGQYDFTIEKRNATRLETIRVTTSDNDSHED